jgi:hypothetical protein
MPDVPPQPLHAELVAELRQLRQRGLTAIRDLPLPALAAAARLARIGSAAGPEPARIEELVRVAVDRLGGGDLGRAAEHTFGTPPGLRGVPAVLRRRNAARVYQLSPERFRKAQEPRIIAQVAEMILGLCAQPAVAAVPEVSPQEGAAAGAPGPAPHGGQPARSALDDHVELFRMVGTECRIGVVRGSIRRVRFADIWVNPENTDMEMARVSEFSISAIIRYGGARVDEVGRVAEDVIADQLAAAVGTRRPVAPGAAIVTDAGRLGETHNVRYVIHVAAVQGEPGAGFRQVRNVGECATHALGQADRLARAGRPARTILIPMLGAGTGGGVVDATVHALLTAAIDYLAATPDTPLQVIYFLAYTEAEYVAFTAALADSRMLSPLQPAEHRQT